MRNKLIKLIADKKEAEEILDIIAEMIQNPRECPDIVDVLLNRSIIIGKIKEWEKEIEIEIEKEKER